jgi:hypothetical protein
MLLKRFDADQLKIKIALVTVLLIIPAVLLEIWSVNRLATLGSKIDSLENTKSQLILENQVLQNQISNQQSLDQVEQKSKELGFQKIKSVTFLGPQNLASN